MMVTLFSVDDPMEASMVSAFFVSFTVLVNMSSLKFDPSGFIPDASGQVEIRVHVPNVSRAAKILEEKGACMAPEDLGS